MTISFLKVLVFFGFLLIGFDFAAADFHDNIIQLWRDRGAKANKRLDEIGINPSTTKQLCEMKFERSFSSYYDPNKDWNQKLLTFTLKLPRTFGKSEGQAAITFDYDNKTGKIIGVRIASLPEDWVLSVLPLEGQEGVWHIFDAVNGCSYILNVRSPLTARFETMEDKPVKPSKEEQSLIDINAEMRKEMSMGAQEKKRKQLLDSIPSNQ